MKVLIVDNRFNVDDFKRLIERIKKCAKEYEITDMKPVISIKVEIPPIKKQAPRHLKMRDYRNRQQFHNKKC